VRRDIPTSPDQLRAVKPKLQQRVAALEMSLLKYTIAQEMSVRELQQLDSQSANGASAFIAAIPSAPELTITTNMLLL